MFFFRHFCSNFSLSQQSAVYWVLQICFFFGYFGSLWSFFLDKDKERYGMDILGGSFGNFYAGVD